MSENIRMAKFELLIADINEKMIDACWRKTIIRPDTKNECKKPAKDNLSLFFDENCLNEYSEVIMNNAVLYKNFPYLAGRLSRAIASAVRSSISTPTPPNPTSVSPKSKLERAKDVALAYRINREAVEANVEAASELTVGRKDFAGYMLLFWSLMILTVDQSQQDKLPLICDFARMMNITDEELRDLVNVIRYIYHEGQASAVKSDNVKAVFEDVLKMYDYS